MLDHDEIVAHVNALARSRGWVGVGYTTYDNGTVHATLLSDRPFDLIPESRVGAGGDDEAAALDLMRADSALWEGVHPGA